MNMQITHQEAHTWIHLKADGGLNAYQRQSLRAHLEQCADCLTYADSIAKLEAVLQPLLKRQWNQPAMPLPINSVLPVKHTRTVDGMVLATRIAAIGAMFVAFLFSAWQMRATSTTAMSPNIDRVPSMPIPSTATRLSDVTSGAENCGLYSYTVDKDDTLAGIAYEFSIPPEEIIARNSLTSNTMVTGQQLVIPLCTSTPTQSVDTATSTLTPDRGYSTITPGG